MATINIQFTPQSGYAGVYRVIAYTTANPTVPVTQVDIAPPFTNPISVSLSVPSLGDYIVKVFALACNKLVGQVNVNPPAPQQNIVFKNSMTDFSYQVQQVLIDAAGILANPIAANGGQYVHPANSVIASNPHSFTATLTGSVPNGTNLQVQLIRAGNVVYTLNSVYNGGAVPMGSSTSVQNGDIFEIKNLIPTNMYTANNGDFKIIVPTLEASFGAFMTQVEFIQGANVQMHPSYNPVTDFKKDIACLTVNEWNYTSFLSATFGSASSSTPSLITLRVYLSADTVCNPTGNAPRLRAVDGLGVVHSHVIVAGDLGSFVDIPNFSVDKLSGTSDVLLYLTLEENI